jgi:hypothetical protein
LLAQFNKLHSVVYDYNEAFLGDSTIATSVEENMFLYALIRNGRFKVRISTVLLYRGSTHGWKAADWHKQSDMKGATVTLFKVKETNLRCGGFTSLNWEAPSSGTYKNDPNSFLF